MPALLSPTGAVLYSPGFRETPAEIAVLLLPGGGERSARRMWWWHPGLLRMMALARPLTRELPQAAVSVLQYSIDGWHVDGSRLLADTRWAIDRLRTGNRRVILVGHSLGGRVALRLGGTTDAVLGLAPWAVAGDPVEQLAGRPVRIAVGSRDRTCPPGPTRALADRAAAAGGMVHIDLLPGLGHAMIRGSRTWQRWAVDVLRQTATSRPW